MKEEIDTHQYDDIIQLPHHVSTKHPQMTLQNRAAQFAPFAALNGYGEATDETARLTNERIELDEDSKAILDKKLQIVKEHMSELPEVTITYFKADDKKEGGSYITMCKQMKKIDFYEHIIVFRDNTRIQIKDIFDMQSDLFKLLDSVCIE